MYSNSLFNDTIEHSAALNGLVGFTDGAIDLAQTFTSSDSPRVETGQQTHQQIVATEISGRYSLGRRTGLSVSISRDLQTIEQAPDSTEWSNQNWFHYEISRRLEASAGFGIGYVSIDPGTDMSYIRPGLQVSWKPTDKLSFDVHGSSDQRRFRNAAGIHLSSPNYGASAQYQPFQQTTVTVSGSRGINPSFFAGQVNENTSWVLGLNQRLLKKFMLNASVRRQDTDYLEVDANGVAVTREDLVNSYTLRLGTAFFRRGLIGLVYQHTRNKSNEALYSFSTNQAGLEVSYSY
jgi:hypothetical protein